MTTTSFSPFAPTEDPMQEFNNRWTVGAFLAPDGQCLLVPVANSSIEPLDALMAKLPQTMQDQFAGSNAFGICEPPPVCAVDCDND
jgi:hypothetical protein